MLRRAGLCSLAIALCCLLALLPARYWGAEGDSLLRIDYIDVGQGDAILFQDGHGFDVLVDGGEQRAGPTVVAFLREQGVQELEVMVASHVHADHIGGLISVLESDIPVGAVVYNGCTANTQVWADFVDAMSARGLTPTPASLGAFAWGDIEAHILHPEAPASCANANDASVVLLMVHRNIRTLLTGDISQSVEQAIIARGTPAAADILKVAHHGSASSSGQVFLEHVGPAEAVICVGNNSYGHPTDAALARLAAAGARIWRTDRHGTITVTSNGSVYTISASHSSWLYLPSIVRELGATS